jgi:aquaporin Z
MNPKALAAEFFGTLWLVLGGCGTAVFATGGFSEGLTVGIYGVAIAFGLTVVTGAYAFGHVSGGHFNPAVTLGLVAGGKFEASKAPTYIVSQVLGALGGAAIIYLIANGVSDWELGGGSAGAFATNGYGDLSPAGFGLGSVLIAEIVLTAIFLVVILGATERRGAGGQAGLAIGLTLALIHLISIPISNTSVNPARSLSQAIFGGGDHLAQVWVFWVAPIVGAVIGGLVHVALLSTDNDSAFA